jgi:hypothetical protein
MSKTRADLITQGHAMEKKMGSCMSIIREKLETQIGDLSAGQEEFEERIDKQQKNVTSIAEQQTRNLWENIEAMW